MSSRTAPKGTRRGSSKFNGRPHGRRKLNQFHRTVNELNVLDVDDLKTLKDSAGVNIMTTLKLKKLFFVSLVLLCSSYSIIARLPSRSVSGSSGLSPTPNNSLSTAAVQTSDSEMTKVRRAIDAGNAVWVVAWAEGDATMIPNTFTMDGTELVAGGKVFKGRKQILALMRDTMQKRGGKAKLTVTTTDVWLDVNTAYETGTAVYEFTVGGQPQILERRYFTVWKRQSTRGSWKIHSNTGVAKQ